MSRSNRKLAARERARFTGEKYHEALRAINPLFGTGQRLIPDAQHADQQWVESAMLHQLLQGARGQWPADVQPTYPLFVEAVYPLVTGLHAVVPVRDVAAFGSALAMQRIAWGDRLSADEISIHCESTNLLCLTLGRATSGVVGLRCSWRKLLAAFGPGAGFSPSQGSNLRVVADLVLNLQPDECAVLSGLLRRIALFVEPIALNWLFEWHGWITAGRTGITPRLPASLLPDLTNDGLGLPPTQLRTLGLDNLVRQPQGAKKGGAGQGDDRNAVSLPDGGAPGPTPPRPVPTPISRRYNNLVVTIMRLDSDHPIKREYQVMRFPRQWVKSLNLLVSRSDDDLTEHLPTAPLNDAITAVLPDCVVIRPYVVGGSEDGDFDWLLAYQPIDPRTIFHLVTAWVRAQKATPEQIQSTLSQLSPNDLKWSSVRISSDAPLSLLARLIPMDVAATLSLPDAQAPIGNLRFVRCPTDNGTELMSWPPQQIDNGEPFSVTIGITTQTEPFSSELLIYFSFGIRRWMSAQGNLAVGQTYPVYLAHTRSYLPKAPPSRHFGMAKIKRVRATRRGSTSWLPGWHEALARVLDHAGCLAQLPTPEQLVAKPLDLLQAGEPAALAFRPGMFPWPKVSEGLPVVDRAELMSWIVGELTPHLQPVSPLLREKHTIYKGLAKSAKSVIPPEALHDALGPRLTVELLTESDLTAQYALECLGERLGVEFPPADELGDAETMLELGPMTIEVRRIAIPRTHPDLTEDSRRSQAAVDAEALEIIGRLGQATQPTISLVEIAAPDRNGRKNYNSNLKSALRHNLARTGRLSQFVAPAISVQDVPDVSDGSGSHDRNRARFSAAIDDLFRQLGVRPVPLPQPTPNTLAGRPALLAIWMIHLDKRDAGNRVPVAVLADPTGQRVRVCTPVIDWQPLHAGLLVIGQQFNPIDPKYEAQVNMRFIEKVIEDAVADYPDTLLLTHAQNLRAAWRFLANSHLEIDVMQFDDSFREPITRYPGLRHVRVRTAERGETPECYGVNGDQMGQPTGLWQHADPRLFASTTGKPARAAGASISVSKIESGMRGGKLTRLNPNAQVWNERLVELCVAGIQDGDQPAHWAALVHNLRDAGPYIHWSTELPWPLQLAKQIGEYVIHPFREYDDLPDTNSST